MTVSETFAPRGTCIRDLATSFSLYFDPIVLMHATRPCILQSHLVCGAAHVKVPHRMRKRARLEYLISPLSRMLD
jgi:hypothetical protein